MRHTLTGFATALLLCTAAPAAWAANHTLPSSPVLAQTFRNAPPAVPEASVAVADGWWRSFGDPVLDRMVEAALAGNFDIAIAAARLEQAAAGLKAARGAALPALNLGGSAAVQRSSIEDAQGKVISRFPGYQRTAEQYGLSGAASWELDLFGRLSAATRAARAEAGAAEAGVAGARLTVAAEVVNTYVSVRALHARLAVAEDRLRTLADTDRLVRLRAARGVAAATETDLSGAQRAGAGAAVPALQAALESEHNRLDVLLGRAPGAAATEMGSGTIPRPRTPDIVDGPASLLARRPDVAAAQRLVAASDARVAEAIAQRYPRLTISAFAGFLANGLSNLLTGGALQTGANASVTAPIFAGGRLRAQQSAAEARLREAVASYRQTALSAVAETEDALNALSKRAAQADALGTAAAKLAAAQARTEGAYKAGAVSLIDALSVERQRLDAQDQALIAQAAAAQAAVATFRALGGGWQMDAPLLAVAR
ncbi:MAG: efflux transporter outer membrane subunit [Novosphingobium sp.]